MWGNQLQLAHQTYQKTPKQPHKLKNNNSSQACCWRYHWFGRLQSLMTSMHVASQQIKHTWKAWCRHVVEQDSWHYHWCCAEQQESCWWIQVSRCWYQVSRCWYQASRCSFQCQTDEFIQILHWCSGHWLTVGTFGVQFHAKSLSMTVSTHVPWKCKSHAALLAMSSSEISLSYVDVKMLSETWLWVVCLCCCIGALGKIQDTSCFTR